MPRTIVQPRRVTSRADLFGAGPFAWAHDVPGWKDVGWHRAILCILVGWVPLAILSAFEGRAMGDRAHASVLFDYAAYGRYVIAAPAFAFAGAVALPELAGVVRQFTDAELIAEHDRGRYDALVESTRRLLLARWIDVTLVLLAFVLAFATSSLLYPHDVSSWVTPGPASAGRLSLAGWWRTLVSQPLFYLLMSVWLWRLLLWTRFLYRTVRLDLRLVAAHPDLLGGLRFALVPLRGFTILAFGMGAITAGSIAESVLIDGQPLRTFGSLIGLHLIFVLALLAGPTLLLMGRMIRLQAWGTFHYGRLATDVGHAFQQRWLADGRAIGSDALTAQDFSATTDLYSIAANVRAINPFVLDARIIIMLATATLLPFVPLLFAVLPLEELAQLALKALV